MLHLPLPPDFCKPGSFVFLKDRWLHHHHFPCPVSAKSHSPQGEVLSPHQWAEFRPGEGIILPGTLGWAHRRGWTKYFCLCRFSKQCTGFSAAWIRCQLLAHRGLHQLLIRDGCKEFKPSTAEKSRSTLWLFLMLFHQPEKSSLWLQTVQSPFFCPPFVQFGLAPSTFLMEKQILSKSHFGDSEMSYRSIWMGIWCQVQFWWTLRGFTCTFYSKFYLYVVKFDWKMDGQGIINPVTPGLRSRVSFTHHCCCLNFICSSCWVSSWLFGCVMIFEEYADVLISDYFSGDQLWSLPF